MTSIGAWREPPERKLFLGVRLKRLRRELGAHPDAHGRGSRRFAELSEPPRAQPAAADRPGPAAPGPDLRHRYPQPSRATTTRPAPGTSARSWPTRCSATSPFPATRSTRWRKTRPASPTPWSDSIAPMPNAAAWSIWARSTRRGDRRRGAAVTPSDLGARLHPEPAQLLRRSGRDGRGAGRRARRRAAGIRRRRPARLAERHGVQVRIAPTELLPDSLRRYDHHRRRLLLSELLGAAGPGLRRRLSAGAAGARRRARRPGASAPRRRTPPRAPPAQGVAGQLPRRRHA